MQIKKSYFGAANGYAGFRSNFDRIFGYPKVEKLFIIKGGPGTGKSTLMRKIHRQYSDRLDCTQIFCSSDPESLDGVLISGSGKTVGIVDGTSPHVLEPMYPGAVEEIINLGDAFNVSDLSRRKDEIVALSNKKKECYSHAYKSLGSAGEVHKYIYDNLLNCGCYTEAEQITRGIVSTERCGANLHTKSDLLTGAFSKNGYTRMKNLYPSKRLVTVANDGIIGYFVMAKIVDMLEKGSVDFTSFPSAFSSDLTDLILTDSTVYALTEDSEYDVNSLLIKECFKGYDECKATYDHYIEEARFSLTKASEYHFLLESIYSGATDFQENEKKYDELTKRIDALLINNVD